MSLFPVAFFHENRHDRYGLHTNVSARSVSLDVGQEGAHFRAFQMGCSPEKGVLVIPILLLALYFKHTQYGSTTLAITTQSVAIVWKHAESDSLPGLSAASMCNKHNVYKHTQGLTW